MLDFTNCLANNRGNTQIELEYRGKCDPSVNTFLIVFFTFGYCYVFNCEHCSKKNSRYNMRFSILNQDISSTGTESSFPVEPVVADSGENTSDVDDKDCPS